MPKFMKRLAVFGTIVSSSALLFQTTVLYPWHEEISKDVRDLRLETEHLRNKIHAAGIALEPLSDKSGTQPQKREREEQRS
jgi:hypothetical protein